MAAGSQAGVSCAGWLRHCSLLLDADKVDQILTNLFSNALNHRCTGGTVALSAALPAADSYYTLTVRDTGPGIVLADRNGYSSASTKAREIKRGAAPD